MVNNAEGLIPRNTGCVVNRHSFCKDIQSVAAGNIAYVVGLIVIARQPCNKAVVVGKILLHGNNVIAVSGDEFSVALLVSGRACPRKTGNVIVEQLKSKLVGIFVIDKRKAEIIRIFFLVANILNTPVNSVKVLEAAQIPFKKLVSVKQTVFVLRSGYFGAIEGYFSDQSMLPSSSFVQ